MVYVAGESTRLVSEYKNKLQLADSETARLQGIVRAAIVCVCVHYCCCCCIDGPIEGTSESI